MSLSGAGDKILAITNFLLLLPRNGRRSLCGFTSRRNYCPSNQSNLETAHDWRSQGTLSFTMAVFREWPKHTSVGGHPQIQLGRVDTSIPGFISRKPTPTPSNLEIAQITQASKIYPQVAEVFAFINLVHPKPVGTVLWTSDTVMV